MKRTQNAEKIAQPVGNVHSSMIEKNNDEILLWPSGNDCEQNSMTEEAENGYDRNMVLHRPKLFIDLE
jgi:hypothetical protein